MNTIKLGDVIVFGEKSKIKAGEAKKEGNYKFFTSSSEQTKYIDEYLFEEESIVIGTGGSANIHYVFEPFSVSTDCFVINVKKDSPLLLQYIYFYLKYNIHVLERGYKGAGLKHISKKYVLNINIPFKKREEQIDIINKISSLEQIKQEISLQVKDIKSFIYSIFINIAGPTSPDYKNWPTFRIEQLAQNEKGSIRSGPFGSDLKHSEFTEEGIRVLGIDNAVNNIFEISEDRFITEEKYEKLKRYTVYPKDVIITIMGTTGRSSVVPEDLGRAITTKHLATLTLNTEICLPEFISYAIHSHPEVLHQIKLKNKGAIMDGLNLGIIKKLNLKVPPLRLQEQFKNSIQKSTQLISLYEKQIEEIELLNKNVIYQYFY